MSTKIYEAYRLKKSSDLWAFTHDTYIEGRKILKAQIRTLYENLLKKKADAAIAEGRKPLIGEGLFEAQKTVRDLLKEEETSPYKSYLNLNVTLTLREYKGRIVVIPYGDNKEVSKLLKSDPRLVEYSYWNNTDRPEEVSAREWKRRETFYDGMDSSKHWKQYLLIELGSTSAFFEIDPVYDMIEEIQKARAEGALKEPNPVKKGKKSRV